MEFMFLPLKGERQWMPYYGYYIEEPEGATQQIDVFT